MRPLRFATRTLVYLRGGFQSVFLARLFATVHSFPNNKAQIDFINMAPSQMSENRLTELHERNCPSSSGTKSHLQLR